MSRRWQTHFRLVPYYSLIIQLPPSFAKARSALQPKNPAAPLPAKAYVTILRQSTTVSTLYAHMTRAAITIAIPSTPENVSCSWNRIAPRIVAVTGSTEAMIDAREFST